MQLENLAAMLGSFANISLVESTKCFRASRKFNQTRRETTMDYITPIDQLIINWKIANPEQYAASLIIIAIIALFFFVYLFIVDRNNKACNHAHKSAVRVRNHIY